MIRSLFGPSTTPQVLRQSLDRSMEAHKAIAERVASAVARSSQGDAANGEAAPSAGDLADDMSRLADTQIRYEAEARLLQLVYQGLRRSISGNG